MKHKLPFLLVALACLIPARLPAQATAFTYQGHLHHAGAPATGLYEITFALHDAATNGNPIGTPVTLAPVPVTNGLFTATLDFGTAAFNGANRWLELSVTVFNTDQPVVTLAPRQPITATPYALHAANALTLGGLDAGSFWRLDGNAGTTAGTHFLGTTDKQPLEIRVNGISAFQIIPTTASIPTIIAGVGNESNSALARASRGSVIAGGTGNNFGSGSTTPWFNVIGGGTQNSAGGSSSTIGGGTGNRITSYGISCTIAGGENNMLEAYPTSAVIGGGSGNRMGGRNTDYSTIAGGANNTIQPRGPDFGSRGDTIGGGMNNTNSGGRGATISGGFENTANAPYATVPGGYQATARRYGQHAHASGSFASNGDAQTSTYVSRANTTDATQTEAFLDGAKERMVLPVNSTWTFDILITARTPGAASAGYQLRGVIENNAGTTALIGTVNKTVLAEDTTAWDVTAVADDTNDALVLRVTGTAGADIRWVASTRTVEVTY